MNESRPFTEMAGRIERIDELDFAGACVILPPGGGDPIVMLVQEPETQTAEFFEAVKRRVDARLQQALGVSLPGMEPGWGR